MSAQIESGKITLQAGEDLAIFRRVKLDSNGRAVYADGTDDHIAVSQTAATADTYNTYPAFEARLRYSAGTFLLTASEAITAGNPVYAADDGKVAATGTIVVGTAREAATADGDQIEILPLPDSATPGDGSVTTDKLAANAVTVAKLATTLDLSSNVLTFPAGQVGNFKRTVTVDTDGATLTASDSGKIITNTGAGAAATFVLPAAAAGLEFIFFVNAAYELRIDPAGSETIALPSSGAQSAAGKYISADAVGEWVHIVAIGTGAWQRLGYAGTWTAES